MPLSEHEQRQLEQIEQSLYADYPRFAHAARRSDPRVHYKRRVVEAAFGFLLGIGMLLGGVVSTYIWIGVAGFVVMLACAMWALNSWRHMTGTATSRSCRRAAGRRYRHGHRHRHWPPRQGPPRRGRAARRQGPPQRPRAASRADGAAGGKVAPAPGAGPLAVSPARSVSRPRPAALRPAQSADPLVSPPLVSRPCSSAAPRAAGPVRQSPAQSVGHAFRPQLTDLAAYPQPGRVEPAKYVQRVLQARPHRHQGRRRQQPCSPAGGRG